MDGLWRVADGFFQAAWDFSRNGFAVWSDYAARSTFALHRRATSLTPHGFSGAYELALLGARLKQGARLNPEKPRSVRLRQGWGCL